jgi:hypothetical protein
MFARRLLRDTDSQFIGDLLSVRASAAYSLRRLYSDYSGALIRVRRSSDNALQDIGATSNGELDASALLAFVGAGNGFVVIWYDLSNNGYHLTQATEGKQPSIVTNGVLNTQNGNLVVSSIGTQGMSNNSIALVTGDADRALNGVFAANSTNGVQSSIWTGNHAANQAFGMSLEESIDYIPYTYGIGDNIFSGSTANTIYVFTANRDSGVSTGFKNGANLGSNSNAISSVGTNIGFGIRPDGGRGNIYLSEMVYFPTALSTTNRQLLERNQGSYYGITVI